jgi:hypothetical protein
MRNLPNKLVFEADGKLSVRVPGKWRRRGLPTHSERINGSSVRSEGENAFRRIPNRKRIDTEYPCHSLARLQRSWISLKMLTL